MGRRGGAATTLEEISAGLDKAAVGFDARDLLKSGGRAEQVVDEFSPHLYALSLHMVGARLPDLHDRLSAAGCTGPQRGWFLGNGPKSFAVDVGPGWKAVAVEESGSGFLSATTEDKDGTFRVLVGNYYPEAPERLAGRVCVSFEEAVGAAEDLARYAEKYRPSLSAIVAELRSDGRMPYGTNRAVLKLRPFGATSLTHAGSLVAPGAGTWMDYARSAGPVFRANEPDRMRPGYPPLNAVLMSTVSTGWSDTVIRSDGGFYGEGCRTLDVRLRLACEARRMVPATTAAIHLHGQAVALGLTWPDARLVHGDSDCGVFALPCAEGNLSALVLEAGTAMDFLLLERDEAGKISSIRSYPLYITLEHLEECWLPGQRAEDLARNARRAENPAARPPRFSVAKIATLLAEGRSSELPPAHSGMDLASGTALPQTVRNGAPWVFDIGLAIRAMDAFANGCGKKFGCEVRKGFDTYDYGASASTRTPGP